jgi:hypothetical protein
MATIPQANERTAKPRSGFARLFKLLSSFHPIVPHPTASSAKAIGTMKAVAAPILALGGTTSIIAAASNPAMQVNPAANPSRCFCALALK